MGEFWSRHGLASHLLKIGVDFQQRKALIETTKTIGSSVYVITKGLMSFMKRELNSVTVPPLTPSQSL